MADWTLGGSEKTNPELLVEIILGIAVVIQTLTTLLGDQPISWAWLGIGVVSYGLIDLLLRTEPGRKLMNWWREIGVAGALIGMTILLVLTGILIWVLRPPQSPLFSFIIGLVTAVTISLLLQGSQRVHSYTQHHILQK